MRIEIHPHTLERARERGTDRDEIEDVLLTGIPVAAKGDRFSRAKVYPYGQERNGTSYEQRRVEVVYVVEDDVIVTVTVYVFYGKWEEPDADHL